MRHTLLSPGALGSVEISANVLGALIVGVVGIAPVVLVKAVVVAAGRVGSGSLKEN